MSAVLTPPGYDVLVVGVDPGPIPGLVAIDFYADGTAHAVQVVQCSANAAEGVLRTLVLENTPSNGPAPVVQIERFVVGRGSMRSGAAGATTRQSVERLEMTAKECGATAYVRSASEVKPWATDERLDAAGLLEATKGMRHARDAARHALFCAVRVAGVLDPLSRKARR